MHDLCVANGATTAPRLDDARPPRESGHVLAMLPWLAIPYDSLTYLLGADANATSQTLPLTALLSVPYLILRGLSLQTTARGRQVIFWMCAAWLTMMALAMLNAVAESVVSTRADEAMRLPTALRQGASMALGISSLVMFQDALLRLGLARCMSWVVAGAIPGLLLGMGQALTGADRVQGLSSEPSHMADMLVFSFLPACWLAQLQARTRWVAVLLGLALLLATFSTTGFLKALFIVGAFFAARGQLARGLVWVAVAMVIGYSLLSLYPDNYVFLIINYMSAVYEQTGELGTGSFIDRFFGFIGPLGQLGNWHGWLGFGFGGDTVYFGSLFSTDTADAIREVKGDIVAISSLQGKMLMYGGVTGYALYLNAWRRALFGTPRGHLTRVMLPALFAASLFSLGPTFLPYLWIWLAIAATSGDRLETTRNPT